MVQVFVKTLTSDRVVLAVRESCAIREMKARLAAPLGCQPHLMRLILEGNELCDEALLREHDVTDGAVILMLPRGELHQIQWAAQRLLQVTTEMQHAVTAHEEYEESLDDAADCFTLRARAAGPLLVQHRTEVRRLRCRERVLPVDMRLRSLVERQLQIRESGLRLAGTVLLSLRRECLGRLIFCQYLFPAAAGTYISSLHARLCTVTSTITYEQVPVSPL